MTIEEHRQEASYLADNLLPNGHQNIHYDHEATSLIALAVERRDQNILDLVDRRTAGWLEGDDDKGARSYLLEAITNLLQDIQD